ncbi:MAG: CocE/NonD family hydrolase [Chloroflexi bacterium]|nr:CocE/NonD family hydrolase [Chloroflexota bacterium]
MSTSDEKKQVPGAIDLPGGIKTDPNIKIDMLWGVKIPMRDGVKLNATIFKPKEMPQPLPLVFTLTPYISDTYQERATWFSKNGYVFALVDVRGRGNSEGEFEPVVNEPHDGHDLVEWFASQPWCNGKISMWGGSYAGYDQWAALKEFPPHLSTIVPVASGYPSLDFPFPRNIFAPYFIQWSTYTSGVTGNANLFAESSFWTDKFQEMYNDHRPMKELDQIAGNFSTQYQTWMKNCKPGPYWDPALPTEQDYARIDVPILTITGHYDGDQNGAMGFYLRHMKYGNQLAKDHHFLVIGPWDHAGTRTPQKTIGGITFGDASMLDMNRLHKEWYDWTMKKGPKPDFLKKRVAYYVMGSEEWKYADSLEEIATDTRSFYLNSVNGYANDVFQSGVMTTFKPGYEKPDQYVYDPLDTRPGKLELNSTPDYLLDQTSALNLFGNGLVYHTEPFVEDTEVSGYVKLTAWIEMDVPDTDFIASLYEILPDGKSISLTFDTMRARYRESLREEKLVIPGEINQYVFDWFTWFSRRISKGSRLRLVFACPNTPQLEKNYNSGGIVNEESGKDARTAHIKLYHDAEHPSCLEIPIVKAGKTGKG